jgi:hypothetical protein
MSPAVVLSPKPSGLVSAGVLGLAIGLLALCLTPGPAAAQDDQAPLPQAPSNASQPQVEGDLRAPAYIAALDGIARLDREGQTETAERGVPIVPGDRIRTEAGRVELAFPDGGQVYLDRYTEVELEDDVTLRLARGRLYLRVQGTTNAGGRLSISAPGAAVGFNDDGEYRVAVGGTGDAVEVELAVIRGQGGIQSDGGNVVVPQGHRAMARDGAAPTTPEWFNPGETTLERWAAEREALWQSGRYASRQYLPSELSSYAATFDRYGSWQNDDTYGAVWYPSSVGEEWRPYNDGRWDYTSNYGWTWIAGGDVWAYPTHHYGRWHTGPRGWFWIPSRHWGAAWVYWAVSPDYIGWCPLGWNGRPALNVFRYDRSYGSRWQDPYRAWSIVARGSFGSRQRGGVRGYADRGVIERDRPAFVLQHRAPGYAPPRSPYPSPYGSRRAAVDGSGGRAPTRGTVSTMSPRSYGRYGSDQDSRGGHAVPRGSASEDTPTAEDPYQRAQPYMRRPDATSGAGDSGHTNTYRRVPSDETPVRSPGLWRDRDRDDDDRDRDRDRGRSGPGYASPGYRAPGSPGMSRPPERDRSPGMSDPKPGERDRRAAPRDDPPRRNDGDGGRDRGDRGGRGNDGGSSRGGAVRRHP